MILNYKKKGFTLIELLVVISIIGVLSTVAMTSLNGARIKARDTKRKQELQEIKKALEIYYTDHGQYPAETYCDSSLGSCGTACPCTGSDWTYSGSYIANVLKNDGYYTSLPVDPINNTTYYYSYEPNCNQSGCVGTCCNYVLSCRLEGGGTYTVRSAN